MAEGTSAMGTFRTVDGRLCGTLPGQCLGRAAGPAIRVTDRSTGATRMTSSAIPITGISPNGGLRMPFLITGRTSVPVNSPEVQGRRVGASLAKDQRSLPAFGTGPTLLRRQQRPPLNLLLTRRAS